ncbi:hypothetical protein BGW42_006908 [Actinomortierella wolfii]|nr:hypothetical protein BGW42_006908 [Actinomortierella wolfii]
MRPDAAAKELYESVHQYELKFSGVGEASAAARPTIGSSSTASIASPSSAVVSSRPHSRPSGSGIRGRGYNACHDGILYGDRNQWATLNADSPPAGWFLAFVTEAILDSVVQVVFMTLVCLATARLQAYLEDWVEATYSQDDHLQEEGQSPSEVKVDVPLADKENTAIVDDEKRRQALVDAGYLDLAEKKTGQ